MKAELMHYGVTGMKWGIRRSPESLDRSAGRKKERNELSKKATSVAKNIHANESDRKRAEYFKQNPATRIIKTAGTIALQTALTDVLSGNVNNYKSMTKKDMIKKASAMAALTTGTVVLNDKLAKSALSNYNVSGKSITKGRSKKLLTKEDSILLGVAASTMAIGYASKLAKMTIPGILRNRQENEHRFNAWGQNIFSQTVKNVVWTSDDGNMAILESLKKNN